MLWFQGKEDVLEVAALVCTSTIQKYTKRPPQYVHLCTQRIETRGEKALRQQALSDAVDEILASRRKRRAEPAWQRFEKG
jgi:uncharacterized membrane-anchored protein